MNDTRSETDKKVRELISKRSGGERVKMTSDMFEAARMLVMASLPVGATTVEARLQLCERLYAGEVDLMAFARALRESTAPTE
jgi:hypothetical protein